MAERKNTNPFASDDSSPHLPPSVYQPNPYPINPAEGNPWAKPTTEYQHTPYQGHVDNNSTSTYSYGHGYNTSSDGSQSNYPYMSMPTPTVNAYGTNSSSYNYDQNAYSSNAYNSTPAYNNNSTNAYEQSSTSQNDNVKDEADNNDDNSTDYEASAVNPGIETHDPDKLKINSQMVKTSFNGTPNNWRLLSRFIQFIASVGAFIFIVGAKPVSKIDTPKGANNVAIIFLYIVSAVSIIYSFSHLILYCLRRWGHKNKAPRWSLILVDAIIGASFGTLMVFLIKDFRCKIGDLNGWCDFYNTSIFFTVLAFVTYFVSFIWDIVGGFKRS